MFLLDRPNLGPHDGPGGVSLGAGRGQDGVAGEPGGRKILNLVCTTISHHFAELMRVLDRLQVRLHGPVHGLPHLRQGEAAPVALGGGGGGGGGGAVGGIGGQEEQEEQGQLCLEEEEDFKNDFTKKIYLPQLTMAENKIKADDLEKGGRGMTFRCGGTFATAAQNHPSGQRT